MNYKTQKFLNTITFGLTTMGSGMELSDVWYNFKHGMRNLKRFFWVVWKHRGWDYQYNLDLLKRGMEVYLTYPNYEVDETRIPKEKDMKRVIQLIENLGKADYISVAEKELGELSKREIEFKKIDKSELDTSEDMYEWIDNDTKEEKEHRDKVYKLSDEIEQSEWKELFKLIEKNAQTWWN